MNPVAISIAAYGAYLLTNGLALFAVPGIALGLLGLPAVEEPWIRVLGLVTGEIGFYFLVAARKDLAAFYPATVWGRGFAALAFLGLVIFKIAPLQLLLFGAIDLLGSVWTWVAIRRLSTGATTRSHSEVPQILDPEVDIHQAESQLNELIVASQFEAAFEKFYAQGVEMRESGSRATKGKQANQFREAALFKIVTNMTAQWLGGSAMGQTTYSQWNYTIQVKSGKSLSYSQVAVRQWRDGLVVDEQFYHPDFPSWFMMEIAAAAA